MADTIYENVGKCIYCGSKYYAPDSSRFLATEHIVPFGLNGDLLLPQATCRKCERITGRVEAIVLKGSLLGCRTILGLKTRSPKERPKALPLFDTSTIPNRKVMVKLEDYPSGLLLAELGPPEALSGIAQSAGIMKPWYRFLRSPDITLLRVKYGLTSFATSSLDNQSFCSMVAKIAHSYAVARIGIDGFEPFLPNFILDPDDTWCKFIGGLSGDGNKTEGHLHLLNIEPHKTLVIIRVQLFAFLGAPIYQVVVGRRI